MPSQASFDAQMSEHQSRWRRLEMGHLAAGTQNGKTYDWIVAREDWKDLLWEGRDGALSKAISAYIKARKVSPHTGVHNLKSSWVLCANLYFPFGQRREDRQLLADFLQANVASEVTSLDAVDLEYAEEGALHPAALLGELGGGRGSGQTSPDLAFQVNGGRGLILTENKFVEHSFYQCSARRQQGSEARPGNPDRSRCADALKVAEDPKGRCHQHAWGRRYWEVLAPVVDRDRFATLSRCPAASAGYQLLRQQALAEGMAASGKYAFVVSSVAYDARNTLLRESLKRTGLSSIEDWGGLFGGRAQFAAFTHQQWVGWVETHAADRWSNWLAYVRARYALGGCESGSTPA